MTKCNIGINYFSELLWNVGEVAFLLCNSLQECDYLQGAKLQHLWLICSSHFFTGHGCTKGEKQIWCTDGRNFPAISNNPIRP